MTSKWLRFVPSTTNTIEAFDTTEKMKIKYKQRLSPVKPAFIFRKHAKHAMFVFHQVT